MLYSIINVISIPLNDQKGNKGSLVISRSTTIIIRIRSRLFFSKIFSILTISEVFEFEFIDDCLAYSLGQCRTPDHNVL
jgi:hypothetical protein